MPISEELLQILCCPESKQPVKMLDGDSLKKLNDLIAQKSVKDKEGNLIEKPVEEALVTTDNKTIYRIDDDIPVMLIESGIAADFLG